MNSERQIKHLVFPGKLAEKIQKKANRFGLSFGEYLRHLAVNDLESSDIEILDEETDENVRLSLEDIKNGKIEESKSNLNILMDAPKVPYIRNGALQKKKKLFKTK